MQPTTAPIAWALACLLLCVAVDAAKEVPRVNKLTLEKFKDMMSSGQPVVVTDVQDTMAIKDWSCESLRRDWPDEPIERFTDGKTVLSTFAGNWESALREEKADHGKEVGGSRSSYLWFPIRDGAPNPKRTNLDKKGIEKLSEQWDVPYFLPQDSLNRGAIKDRIEVFAGVPGGSGTKLHIDSVCQCIFSMQLSGHKRWFLSPPHESSGDAYHDPNDDIPKVTEHAFETVLGPGDTLFFPTAFIHGTKTEDTSNCSLSASFQYFSPKSGKLLRRNNKILTHAGELTSCYLNEWGPAIQGVRPLDVHKGGIVKRLKKILPILDTNADGSITKDEMRAVFARYDKQYLFQQREEIQRDFKRDVRKNPKKEAAHVKKRDTHLMSQEFAGTPEDRADVAADCFFEFHDTNNDGVVSHEEYSNGYTEFQSELLDSFAGMSAKARRRWTDEDFFTFNLDKIKEAAEDDEDDEDDDDEDDEDDGESDFKDEL